MDISSRSDTKTIKRTKKISTDVFLGYNSLIFAQYQPMRWDQYDGRVVKLACIALHQIMTPNAKIILRVPHTTRNNTMNAGMLMKRHPKSPIRQKSRIQQWGMKPTHPPLPTTDHRTSGIRTTLLSRPDDIQA